MLKRPLKTLAAAAVVFTVVGAGLGFGTGSDGWSVVVGVAIGLCAALVWAVLFGVATIAGRTPEASAPEFGADSVEHRVFTQALAGTATDSLTVMILSMPAWLLGLTEAFAVKAVMVGIFVFTVVDLAVRVSVGWRRTVASDAQ